MTRFRHALISSTLRRRSWRCSKIQIRLSVTFSLFCQGVCPFACATHSAETLGSHVPVSQILLPPSFSRSLFLSLYCNVQNIGRCRRTSKSYESAAAGAEREGEERSCGEGSEGRRIRIWMACVHTPRQGQDMAESTQLSEMCRKKMKKKKKQRKKLRQVYFPSFFFFFSSFVSLFSSNFFLFFPLLLSLSLSHTEHFALFTACAARRLQVMGKRGTGEAAP